MKPRRTTSICIEVYETLYKLNPIFRLNVSNRLQRERYKFNLDKIRYDLVLKVYAHKAKRVEPIPIIY